MFPMPGHSPSASRRTVVIVGAGLAGLACATRLQEAGLDWVLLESEPDAGGRVRTLVTPEGYRLDRGFQVLLDSYPTASRLLDLEALNPRYFESGALMVDDGGWERIRNPLRHPGSMLAGLTSRSFSPREKGVLALHAARQILRRDSSLLRCQAGCTTMEELVRLGLDGEIMRKFLRPFFAGVFLDQDLGSDASIFRYDLKKFALGRALLPSAGMGEIPAQLQARLPSSRLRLGATVESLELEGGLPRGVVLQGGESIPCDLLVLATDERTSLRLLGLSDSGGRPWREVSTLYFTGDRPLYEGAVLVLPSRRDDALHGVGTRFVTHFTDLTNIAPDYAPEGKRLLSATVLIPRAEDSAKVADLVSRARAEIESFLPAFARWVFLREIRIRHALPSQAPGFPGARPRRHPFPNLWLAGDQVAHSSIESALASGLDTAEEVLDALRFRG